METQEAVDMVSENKEGDEEPNKGGMLGRWNQFGQVSFSSIKVLQMFSMVVQHANLSLLGFS